MNKDTSPPARTLPGALVDVAAIAALVVWVCFDKMSVLEAVGALLAVHSGRFRNVAARYLPRQKGPPTLLGLLILGSGFLSVVAGVLLLPRVAVDLSRGVTSRGLS